MTRFWLLIHCMLLILTVILIRFYTWHSESLHKEISEWQSLKQNLLSKEVELSEAVMLLSGEGSFQSGLKWGMQNALATDLQRLMEKLSLEGIWIFNASCKNLVSKLADSLAVMDCTTPDKVGLEKEWIYLGQNSKVKLKLRYQFLYQDKLYSLAISSIETLKNLNPNLVVTAISDDKVNLLSTEIKSQALKISNTNLIPYSLVDNSSMSLVKSWMYENFRPLFALLLFLLALTALWALILRHLSSKKLSAIRSDIDTWNQKLQSYNEMLNSRMDSFNKNSLPLNNLISDQEGKDSPGHTSLRKTKEATLSALRNFQDENLLLERKISQLKTRVEDLEIHKNTNVNRDEHLEVYKSALASDLCFLEILDREINMVRENFENLLSVSENLFETSLKELSEHDRFWQDGIQSRGARKFIRSLDESLDDAGTSLLSKELQNRSRIVNEIKNKIHSLFSFRAQLESPLKDIFSLMQFWSNLDQDGWEDASSAKNLKQCFSDAILLLKLSSKTWMKNHRFHFDFSSQEDAEKILIPNKEFASLVVAHAFLFLHLLSKQFLKNQEDALERALNLDAFDFRFRYRIVNRENQSPQILISINNQNSNQNIVSEKNIQSQRVQRKGATSENSEPILFHLKHKSTRYLRLAKEILESNTFARLVLLDRDLDLNNHIAIVLSRSQSLSVGNKEEMVEKTL